MCIDASELQEIFEPLLRIYTDVNEFMPAEEMRELDHIEYFFASHLTDDWMIFSDNAATHDNFYFRVNDFLEDVFSQVEHYYLHDSHRPLAHPRGSRTHASNPTAFKRLESKALIDKLK